MLIIKAGPIIDSNVHSLGNQLLQARAIACRGPEDHCKLRFRIGQQRLSRIACPAPVLRTGNGKKAWCFCWICLSAQQLGKIRIIRIVAMPAMNTIEIIEIISKIVPAHQELPRHQRPSTSLYRALHYCPQIIPQCHGPIQSSCSSPHAPRPQKLAAHDLHIYGLCNIGMLLFPCVQRNSTGACRG